jgi:hypothetical protein
MRIFLGHGAHCSSRSCRNSTPYYSTRQPGAADLVKWEAINGGDEEGHVVATFEDKGIVTELEGRKFEDGGVNRSVGLMDMNVKTGLGSGSGYLELTDRDGDKYYMTWKNEAKIPTIWEGKFTIVKGTGKYEGMHGKGTFVSYAVAPGQYYVDWEEEVELPR